MPEVVSGSENVMMDLQHPAAVPDFLAQRWTSMQKRRIERQFDTKDDSSLCAGGLKCLQKLYLKSIKIYLIHTTFTFSLCNDINCKICRKFKSVEH